MFLQCFIPAAAVAPVVGAGEVALAEVGDHLVAGVQAAAGNHD